MEYVDTDAVTEAEYDREDPFRFRRRTHALYHEVSVKHDGPGASGWWYMVQL